MKTEEVSKNRNISQRSNIPGVASGADLADDIRVEEGDLEPGQEGAV